MFHVISGYCDHVSVSLEQTELDCADTHMELVFALEGRNLSKEFRYENEGFSGYPR